MEFNFLPGPSSSCLPHHVHTFPLTNWWLPCSYFIIVLFYGVGEQSPFPEKHHHADIKNDVGDVWKIRTTTTVFCAARLSEKKPYEKVQEVVLSLLLEEREGKWIPARAAALTAGVWSCSQWTEKERAILVHCTETKSQTVFKSKVKKKKPACQMEEKDDD